MQDWHWEGWRKGNLTCMREKESVCFVRRVQAKPYGREGLYTAITAELFLSLRCHVFMDATVMIYEPVGRGKGRLFCGGKG